MPGLNNPSRDDVSSRQRRWLRRFRLWGKKRGTHSTGSTRLAGAGEAVFFAAIFLTSVVALTELGVLRVINQSKSVLVNGWGMSLSILVLGSLIALSAIGVVYNVFSAGTTAERRAAFAKRGVRGSLSQHDSPNGDFPNVPSLTNWTNSPGIRLTFRLPITSTPAWRLLAVATYCLLWNGAVAVLAVLAINRSAASMFRAMVFVYLVIGLFLIFRLFSMLIAAAAIGPTSIEVAEQPMRPGNRYRVYLAQAGHLHIEHLELRLVCYEEASYTNGTDTRTETVQVHDRVVFQKQAFDIVPSEPFQHECDLELPETGMHSFVSPHNAVIWKLVVTAQAKKWPSFQRTFPLVVYPASPKLTS